MRSITIELSVLHEEDELDICFELDYSPGCAAQGPSYASGGEPAEPSEATITAMSIPAFDQALSPEQWPAEVQEQLLSLKNQAEELACEEGDEGYDEPDDDRCEPDYDDRYDDDCDAQDEQEDDF